MDDDQGGTPPRHDALEARGLPVLLGFATVGAVGLGVLYAVLWFLAFWERNRLGAIALLAVGGAILVGGPIGAWLAIRNVREKRRVAREEALRLAFGDEGARTILAGRLWVGAPVAAVAEVLGTPAGIDEHVTEGRVRRMFKYAPDGGSFRVRVTVDDDRVTGWDDRVGILS